MIYIVLATTLYVGCGLIIGAMVSRTIVRHITRVSNHLYRSDKNKVKTAAWLSLFFWPLGVPIAISYCIGRTVYRVMVPIEAR